MHRLQGEVVRFSQIKPTCGQSVSFAHGFWGHPEAEDEAEDNVRGHRAGFCTQETIPYGSVGCMPQRPPFFEQHPALLPHAAHALQHTIACVQLFGQQSITPGTASQVSRGCQTYVQPTGGVLHVSMAEQAEADEDEDEEALLLPPTHCMQVG